jgi:hypothetical protein
MRPHRTVGALNPTASQSHVSLRLPVPQGHRKLRKHFSREDASALPEKGEGEQPSEEDAADHFGNADLLFHNVQVRPAHDATDLKLHAPA